MYCNLHTFICYFIRFFFFLNLNFEFLSFSLGYGNVSQTSQSLAGSRHILSKACQCQGLIHRMLKPLNEFETAARTALTSNQNLDLFFPDTATGGLNKSQVCGWTRKYQIQGVLPHSTLHVARMEKLTLQPGTPSVLTGKVTHKPNLLGSKWFIKILRKHFSSVSTGNSF